MAEVPSCGNYLTPEEIQIAQLQALCDLVGRANLVEIETSGVNRKLCLVSNPAIEVNAEIVRNEDGNFKEYVLHYLDGSGTRVVQADLTGVQICEESLLPTLQAILDKFNESCAGAPINVVVCNPTDLSVVEALLNSILASVVAIDGNTDGIEADLTTIISQLTQNNVDNATIIANLQSVVAQLILIEANTDGLEALLTSIETLIQVESDQSQAILTTIDSKIALTNLKLDAVNAKLGESCAGAPINVVVCNQIDTTALETKLDVVIAELQTANTTLISIDGNTDGVEAELAAILAELGLIKIDIQAGNVTLASIDARILAANLTLDALLLSSQAIEANTDQLETQLSSVISELQSTQVILQNEFDETQVLIAATNTKLDTVITKLNQGCGGSPINVTVCNQISTVAIENLLNTVVGQLANANVLLTEIDINTQNLEGILTLIRTDLANVILNIQQGTAFLSSIDAELVTLNSRVLNLLISSQALEANTDALEAQLTSVISELQSTQVLLQNEFDETQVLISSTNTKLDTVITSNQAILDKLNGTCALDSAIEVKTCEKVFEPIPGGGQLSVTDSAVVDLTSVVDTINSGVAFPIPVNAVGALIQVVGGDVLYTVNGTNPDNTGVANGYAITDKFNIYLGEEPRFDNSCASELTTFKIIAQSGQAAVLQITYYEIK